jgi:pseudouridine-5'-monophosphatase
MLGFLLKICIIFLMSCESINKNLNKKIKAAIFDLDGTLIDTQKLYDEANQLIINKYGNGKPYDSELKLKIHGSSPRFGNRYLLKHFEINLSFEEFMKLKDDYIKDKIATCKEMEGASKLIKNLRNKYQYKMAIATSSFKSSAETKLANHKEWVESYFDAIITGEDKRIKNGKPSPDIFILAAKSIGMRPEECIIFEDAVNGVQAGLNSGAGIVIGLPEDELTKKAMENLPYDKNKTKLYILNSLLDFDYSIIED